MSDDIDSDRFARTLRDSILRNDEAILAALNRRIRLVEQLRDHKAGRGYPAIDPARESRLLEHLVGENGGPAEEALVREVFGTIVAATKRQVYGSEGV